MLGGGITLSTAWLATVALLSLRLAAVFLMTPLLAASSALAMGLPGGMVGAGAPLEVLASPGAMVAAACTELALGATLALGILLAFAAFSMAGQLLGVQMGLGLAQVLDPVSNRNQPVVAAAFDQLAIVVFFLAGGHHALLRGIAYSLERFPLGRAWPLEAAVGPMLQQVLGLFSL